MKYDEKFVLRSRPGTLEHLWEKWYKKLWLSYAKHSDKGLMEPPAFMRKEFYRDVGIVIENRVKEIAPESSVAGSIHRMKD